MKFGTLRIRFLDGTDKEFPLDLPSAVVGRGEGVSLFIDDFSISRRHARLTVDSSRLMVEDLGSAAGTFLNGERLTPHVRYLVDEGAQLQIGDLETVYYPPPPAEASAAASEESDVVGGLHVVLISPGTPVETGRTVTATLVVTNRGRIVDDIVLSIPQLPADWYTLSTTRMSLLPSAREEVQVAIHPPRTHEALAGEYDLAIEVESREQQRQVIASGSFTILPFESASVSLATMRSRRDFKVVAENTGNQPIVLDLAGRDDDDAFHYVYQAPSVELRPGEKAIVPLRVNRQRQLFGPPTQPFFEVVGKSRDNGSEVTARGQLAITPPLEKFKMPVLFMLGAIILAFTAIAVLILTDGGGVQTAGAESEYAGVHLCDDPAPENDSGGGTASDGTPRADATIAGTSSGGGTPVFGNVDADGGPFFAQNDPRWGDTEYARSTDLPGGKDWCGTTIAQCGCAMTSVGVMLALYGIIELPDGSSLNPQSLNAWFNGEAKRTERGWVSRGYIYGDVIWAAANAISGEMAKANPGIPTIRFVRKGTGSEDEIRAELSRGRPVILEVPGHWIAAVGLTEGGTILINDPFYRDRTTLDVYAGKVRSSVIYEPSNDLSAVVLTAPSDVKFRVIDKQGRVVGVGEGADAEAVVQIPGASFENRRAWRDPTCIEQAPPPGAGTNQIVLPGNADDYTIEILDTGGQPGSVAVHTYGRDGTASIATIDTEGAAVAELSVDPDAGTTDVEVTEGGQGNTTPTPPLTTPTPGGGGGGADEETPTPTEEPTQGPPPTPTPTPFEAATTNITLGAEPGQTRVETASNSGFELGDPIRFAPGQPNEEDNIIVGFGSMLLATPLKFAHGPGEVIERLPRPEGQGPGLPPGITPPPDEGPLEPPSTVGLACSTIYQPSPKLATFICDLQVTGDYTTTRWTLNGQVVPDFTGSNSFIMTFDDDTPASVSASVCNVTICRSVSRSEAIDFGTGLAGQDPNGGGNNDGTGGNGGTNGGGSGATPTPVPQGQVVVVCQTTFPISEDGQSAQFACEANFSGEYTSIAWSAPGGTPANKSGIDKTFETFIRNEPGAPVTLSVTATVCNFGTCMTSQPRLVGIGRTFVIMDSSPLNEVHNGHRLTLMARVQGVQSGQGGGAITPQGGTVQFYVDPPIDPDTGEFILDPTTAFGPSAPLFTTGDVAVAQVAVDTSGLDFGTTPSGQEHLFIGAYSGGTNAFGSTSEPRVIVALPPIPDGCDSVDEDDDNIIDNTCKNAQSLNGFSAPGGYAVPKDLGGGTIVTSVALSSPQEISKTANTITVSPNAEVTVTGKVGRSEYCPGCVRQLYIGIGPNASSGTPPIGPVCVRSGGFQSVVDASGRPIENAGQEWTTGQMLRAPAVPGVYYVRATTTLDYFCVGPQVGPPEVSIARIIVWDRDATTTVSLHEPPGSNWLETPPGELNPVTEINSNGQVLLRAVVDPQLVPTGRIRFNHDANLFQVGSPLITSLEANICPASGLLPTGACVPGEARILAQARDVAAGRTVQVTAEILPQRLLIPEPIEGSSNAEVIVRSPAATPSNQVQLVVTVPSTISVTVTPDDDVEICAPGFACPQVVLNASVVGVVIAPGATPSVAGGQVEFYYRPASSSSNDDWELLGTEPTDAAGQATWPIDPGQLGDEEGLLGGFEFQARFLRGTTNLEPSSSAPSNTVTFIKAEPTVVVNSVTPASPTVGDQITVTATVTGANGYQPEGGQVQFRVRTATGATGSFANFGNAVSLVASGEPPTWTATLNYTTGQENSPLSNSGDYVIEARFLTTDTLSQKDSAGFNLSLQSADPQIHLCFPNGASPTVGDSALIRVVLVPGAGSQASRLDDNSAYIEFRHNGTTITGSNTTSRISVGTSTISCGANSGRGAEFNVQTLAAGTYNVTAHYSGNNYYSSATTTPAETLTIQQFVPTVTLASVNAVSVGNNISLSASLQGTGLRSPAGGSVSFYVGSVSEANRLGTDTTLTASSGTYTATLTYATGGSSLLPSADTAYTIIAQYNGDATNDNVAVSSGTADGTNSKSVTLNKRTPTVTVANQTATLGQNTSFTVTINSGSSAISPDCTDCVQFKYGASVDSATNIGGKESVGGGIATLPNVNTGSGTPFPANGTYTIWAVYDGNANVAAGNDSGTLNIAQAVQVTVSSPVAAGTVNQAIVLTATVDPSAATGSVQFRANGTNISTPVNLSSGSATRSWTPTQTGTYVITAIYTSNNNNYLSDPVSNEVSVAIGAVTSVSVTGNTTGVYGSSENFAVSVRNGSGALINATGTLALFVNGGSIPVDTHTLVTGDGGQATLSWTPDAVGNATITATFTTNAPATWASDVTSNSHTINVRGMPVTVTVSTATNGAVGVPQTLTATVSPTAAPGTIQFRVNNQAFGSPVTLSSGTATISWTPANGDHFGISATYASSNTIYESENTSNTVTVVVPIPTTTTATATQTGAAGSSTTLRADIVPASLTKNDVDFGTVQFRVNGANQGSPVNVTNGVATLAVSLAPGTYQIQATYSGGTGSGTTFATSADTTDFEIVVT